MIKKKLAKASTQEKLIKQKLHVLFDQQKKVMEICCQVSGNVL